MKIQNSLEKREAQGTFSMYMSGENVRKQINAVVGRDSQMFITSILSAVSANPELQACEHGSLLSGALLGQSLKLSPSPTLGHYYLIPFNDKKLMGIKKAQFVLGYKGYLQLAIRSGQYRDIDCIEIREGEYLGRDDSTGKHRFSFIEDDTIRLDTPIIGYLAYFELLNGFKKEIYWSKEKMTIHADTYSKAFNAEMYKKLLAGKIPKTDMWKYSSFWYKNFDEMAFKTLLRHLLSRWGIMSIEMQKAYESDIAEEIANNNDNNNNFLFDKPQIEDNDSPQPTIGDTVDEIEASFFGADNDS